MKIKITTDSPDTLNGDVLALGLFMDDRPPKGHCGLVDWRLNGLISREIARGHISATFKEKTLIDSSSRITVSKILLFGLGRLSQLTYDKLYHTGYQLSEAMAGILCKDFIFNIPAAGLCPLTVPEMTESIIRGCYDFLSKDIEKWATSSTGILVHESYIEDVVAGLQNFKHNVRDVSVIEIS